MNSQQQDKPLYFQGKWWFISEDRASFSTEIAPYPRQVYLPRFDSIFLALLNDKMVMFE